MLRVLKSELAANDGILYVDGTPFSGLAFDVDSASDAFRVAFDDASLSCQPIRAIESYSNGKPSGEFVPLEIELVQEGVRLLALEEFPYFAQDFLAKQADGNTFSGIIYVPGRAGWEARTYTQGDQETKLVWYVNGVLVYAISYTPIHENFRWYEDGSSKQAWLHNGGMYNIELTPDGRLSSLILRNWKDVVNNKKRKFSFKCATTFAEILKYRSSSRIHIDFDEDVSRNVSEILCSGTFDDAETINWNGDVINSYIEELFATLSKRRLKKVIFNTYKDDVAHFCQKLGKMVPELEIVSVAFNSNLRI